MAPPTSLSKPRVLLTGSSGFLGGYLVRALTGAEAVVVTAGRSAAHVMRLDLADPESARRVAAGAGCGFVLHAAAMAAQGECEREPERARVVNHLSTVALLRGAPRWLFVSTDLVFDGTRAPYREGAATSPLSVYGRTKAEAEAQLLSLGRGLVVRIPLLFGKSPGGDRGATDMVRAAATSGRPATLFTDEYRTPLHAADAAGALVRLLLSDAEGLLHLPGPERVSRYALGTKFVSLAGLPPSSIRPGLRTEMPGPPRPEDVSLATGRLELVPRFPALEDMLRRS